MRLILILTALLTVVLPSFAENIENYYQQKIQMIIEKSKAVEDNLRSEFELKIIKLTKEKDEEIKKLKDIILGLESELNETKDQIKDLREKLNLAEEIPAERPERIIIEKGEPHPEKLNLNGASFEELIKLNHLNERTANYIIWYRENIEKFKNLNDLQLVPGINETIYENVKENFYVE